MNTRPDTPGKQDWRARVLAERATTSPAQHDSEAAHLALHVVGLVTPRSTVCAYVPVGREPGSLAMLDALRHHGVQVLLPIARDPGPLSWAAYDGPDTLVRARYGLREPVGPVQPPAAIGTAAVVLLPALAVDRRGVRLGRGAGFYDRTLDLAAPDALLVAVVRDGEIVDELPEDPHDRRVDWALTPGHGPVRLGTTAGE
ncbi:MAG TPA: 5-formyltetrahydrofolate cyclo-ligase [Aldersonia sp.]